MDALVLHTTIHMPPRRELTLAFGDGFWAQ